MSISMVPRSVTGLNVLGLTLVLGVACGPDTATVIVTNQSPMSLIDSPSQDTTVALGGAVNFQGSASDVDGTVVAHAWTFGDGGMSTLADPGAYTYGSTGTFAVTYRVTDDDGAQSVPAGRTVTVVSAANQSPMSLIDSPSQDTTVALGGAVNFQGSASDVDGTVVAHAWTFGDGGMSTLADPGAYTYGSTGTFAVTYRVTDDDGAQSVPAGRTVTVVSAANQSPMSLIDSPSQDTTVALGGAVNFQGSASDVDGTVVAHAWTFGDGGMSTLADPGAYTYGSTGTFAVTYRVTDDDGAQSVPAGRTVTVVSAANQSPMSLIDSPSQDTTVALGGAVNFQGSASDVDGTVVAHAWTFGDGGMSTLADPGAYTYGSTGTFAVTYRVTDDDGAQSVPAGRTVTVVSAANQSPMSLIDSPSQDTTVALGGAVNFQGSASDVDGTVVAHAWTFGDGGMSTLADPGAYTYGSTGTFAVTYRVTDDDGAQSVPAGRTVTVVSAANQSPMSLIDSPSQDTTVALGGAVNFQGSASDVDGTVVAHAWTFGDGGMSTLADPGAYTYGSTGTFAVTYRVTDDDGAQSVPAGRTVTVVSAANQSPMSLIDSPSQDTTVALGGAVNFQGSASDVDGTVVAHAWTFGDGGMSTLADPGAYTYGSTGTFAVTYRVTDDDGAQSVPAGRTVTVVSAANQSPMSLIDSPSQDTTVALGGAVNFQGSASDVDGTVVAHAWTFGDGGMSTLADPGAYTYGSTGTFAVTYRVTDDDGAQSVPAGRTVTVVAPGTNYALRFYGDGTNDRDRVKIVIGDDTNAAGPPINVGATDFSVEFWMRADVANNSSSRLSNCSGTDSWIGGNIIVDRDRQNRPRSYGISMHGGYLAFGTWEAGNNFSTVCGSSFVGDDQWHHVAFTRDASSGQLAIYVDGVRDSTGAGPSGDISYPASDPSPGSNDRYIVIGAEKHDIHPVLYPAYNGLLDELRYSDILRYTGASFPVPSSRLASDIRTVALYHFDEGTGTVINDSSGVAVDPRWGDQVGNLIIGGSPAGPQWVVSTAPTGN